MNLNDLPASAGPWLGPVFLPCVRLPLFYFSPRMSPHGKKLALSSRSSEGGECLVFDLRPFGESGKAVVPTRPSYFLSSLFPFPFALGRRTFRRLLAWRLLQGFCPQLAEVFYPWDIMSIDDSDPPGSLLSLSTVPPHEKLVLASPCLALLPSLA